jgi:hypothetical protein
VLLKNSRFLSVQTCRIYKASLIASDPYRALFLALIAPKK